MRFFVLWIWLLALSATCVLADYNCKDRSCFVSTNENNEKIFDCKLEKIEQDLVKCFYFPNDQKLIITTKDNASYVKIHKIAPGAFKRLVSGIIVKKIYFNKFQTTSLDSTDFDGLINMSEMRIENPQTMDRNTFVSLATRKTFFILTISCTNGNKHNSFDRLYLKSEWWRVHSENCGKQITCEITECDRVEKSPLSKIISSNAPANPSFQMSSHSCLKSQLCQSNDETPEPKAKPRVSLPTTSTQRSRARLKMTSSSNSDNYYDGLMWVVLVLTTMNSVVIMGILLFLVFWWKKLSSSTANKKHTIILENGLDKKYLKLGTFS